MAFADFDQIDTNYISIREAMNRTFPVLSCTYGDGFSDFAVVGAATGLLKWTLRSKALLDNSRAMVGSKTAFQYWLDFIQDHTTGSKQVFILPWRSAYWSVRFDTASFDFTADDAAFKDVYNATITATQARVASGLTYNSDGSVNPI